jgi:VanZ family protein
MAVAVGYMLLILITSVIPKGRALKDFHFIIELRPMIQNLLHIPMYAILTILWMQMLKQYDIGGTKRIVLVFFLSSVFGVLNELIQLTIPGRYASIFDIGLNTIGIVCGISVYFLLERSKPGPLRRIVASK